MKKCMIAVACLIITSFAMAQNRPSVIIKGGVNLANITETTDGKVDNSNTLTSFHAGAVVNIPFTKGFAFQPGLLVSGKGAKIQDGNTNDNNYFRSTTNPIYLELPLNFVGTIPLGKNAGIFLGAGPYVAMGIAGKNKVEGKFLGASFSREDKIDFSNDDPTTLDYEEDAGIGKMKRFDLGANVLAGVDFGKFLLSANYGFGFTKINSGGDNNADQKNKNRVLGLSLGVKF